MVAAGAGRLCTGRGCVVADDPVLAIGAPEAPEVNEEPAGLDDVGGDDLADVEPADPAGFEPLIRVALVAVTEMLAATVGDEDVPDHWRMTEGELDQLVPPLARMAAVRPQVARALEQADPLTAGLVLLGYTARNMIDGSAARRARGDDDGDGQREAGSASWGVDPADSGPAQDPGPSGWPAGGDAPRGYGLSAPPG